MKRNLRQSSTFQHAMSGIDINNVHLKNRLFFSAMGLDLANNDGTFSEAQEEFYDGIVNGGCGFLILSNTTISCDSVYLPKGLHLYNDSQVKSLKGFIEKTRSKNVEVGIQLQHYGGQCVTTYSDGAALLTPSGIPCKSFQEKDPNYKCRAMTQQDIDLVIKQFAHSALLAELAGAKLIQLQASNGYLLSSFFSPATNKRKDAYGGGPKARARFLIEVIKAIKEKIGPDIILGVRLGVDDCIGDAGTTPSDFETVIPLLEGAGMDLIEISVTTADTFSKFLGGDDCDDSDIGTLIKRHARQIKSYSRVPVGLTGLVKSVREAEDIIENETADLVGMARALFADNDLIVKSIEGRQDEINWCKWDGKCFTDKHNPKYDRVYCCVNPKYKRPE